MLDCGDWLMGPIISQQVTLYSIQTSTHLGDHTVVSLLALSINLLTIIIVPLAIIECRANLACISLQNFSLIVFQFFHSSKSCDVTNTQLIYYLTFNYVQVK